MPKPLKDPVPTSSIARLFDMGAAARAVSAPTEEPPTLAVAPEAPKSNAPRSQRRASGEQPTLKRELVLTPSADKAFGDLVDLYRRTTQSRLTASHVGRAVMKGIAHCFDQLEREARRIGPLKLPPNARGRELDRERFEARIADAFVAGIRNAPALNSDTE